MKKIIAINGSPRKRGNTTTLLQYALDGAASLNAETEIVHLYELNYKGCISCFACKRIDGKGFCKCAMKDELSPILEKVMSSDAVILGSPIYLSDVTGEMRSFIERFIFMNLSYDKGISNYTGKLNVGSIYTMNVPESMMEQLRYNAMFDKFNNSTQSILHGKCEYMTSNDTYQFDDYSKYAAGHFDEKHKREVKEEQFPLDCQKAFEIGKRLIE
jgi:multimeric flavodoxin WrbA